MKRQFRKSTLVLLTLLVFVALSATVFAAGRWVQAWQDDTLKIKFDGAAQTFTDPDDGSQIVPLVYNGRTYLPVRAIATLAGLGVDYDDASHSVLLTSGGSAPANDNEQGDKPYKDAQSFNNAASKTVTDLNVQSSKIKPGTYTNTDSSKTRRLVKDDFKSLTEYGFDVNERLAEPGDYAFQSVQIMTNYKSFDDAGLNYKDEEKVASDLYTNIVTAAKSNGWVVKKEGQSTSYDSTTYPKIYLYKDGLYLEVRLFGNDVELTIFTYDGALW